MRSIQALLLTLTIVSFAHAQKKIPLNTAENGESAKAEFWSQFRKDTSDYSLAYRLLTEQVRQDPKNAELRYFLGYTIDRLNTEDGSGMPYLTKEMTLRSSEQFETVIKLEPKYKGELIILDPYAKLGSIWGSLAQAYLTKGNVDSAKWAFAEGKRRGGFSEPFLEFNRQMLASCPYNSILITSGDVISINIWYLQTVEALRTDITVVDAGLIGAAWYVKYLKARMGLRMNYSDQEIDTIDYIEWKPKTVEAVDPQNPSRKFSWVLSPTYWGEYILKGDRMLLDIIQSNFFSRPIYFGMNSDSTYNLFLTDHLFNEGIVSRLSDKVFDPKTDFKGMSYNMYSYNINLINSKDIFISSNAIHLLNNFRWAFAYNADFLTSQNRYDEAKSVMVLMKTKFSKKKLPYVSEAEEEYFDTWLE